MGPSEGVSERSEMSCPNCGSRDHVNIEINLTEDDRVSFFQCRSCEHKWWERDGGTIALDDVLDLTAEKDRPR